MRIGVISDSPLLTTGFGVEAYQTASALAEAGHDVACFGLKGKADDAADDLPFRVWHIDVASRWDLTLRDFFEQERPDQIVILIDLFNLRQIIDYCQQAAWRGKTIVYLTPDGLPAYDEYVEVLRRADQCVVTTEFCKRYLSGRDIPVWGVAPPGVDGDVFRPLPHRDELRRAAGLADRFVVGVFGRNYERKQQPRVLQALAALDDPEVVAYFHCQTRGHWNLDEIARELKVTDGVLFAGLESEFRGVPYSQDAAPAAGAESPAPAARMPPEYGYVERLNCCDLVVNAAHSGDVEHIIMESQSCGVPLAHTDDEGIMAEGMGDGALPLRPIDVGWGRIGERIYMVDPQAIAEAIRLVKQDVGLRRELRRRGFVNVKHYTWSRLREMMVEVVRALG